MRRYALWMLRQGNWRELATSWFVLRSRTLTFERLRATYPKHDIHWVNLIVPEEI